MIYFSLFLQFVKYGLLCFGGGYMIIPLLYSDLVQNEHFFSPENYGNLLSISQMTPGAVSINTATYVGYLKGEFLGAIIATIGLCFPTFILASIILNILYEYKETPFVAAFFKGAKWPALIMIISAIVLFANISVIKSGISIIDTKINLAEVIIMIMCIILSYKKIPFTVLLFLSGVIGYSISYLQ